MPNDSAHRYLGALFDMDGLLLDSERLLLECSRQVGFDMNLGDLYQPLLSVTGVREAEAKLKLAPSIGDADAMLHFEEAVRQRYQHALDTRLLIKPTVVELLQILKAKGIACAVATSSDRAHAVSLLTQTSLLGYFRSVTGGDDVTNPKPHPEIYQHAARSLGIEPRQAVAFEDSEPGTRAAIASGATVVQVPDMVQPSESLLSEGHCIASDVLSGARAVGLIAAVERSGVV